MTYLYLEYTGTGPTAVITKWRPGVTMEAVQELLRDHRPGEARYDYSPMGSDIANYWEGVMRGQVQKMVDAPIDVEDGTWTMVVDGVETPIAKRESNG